jgi:hypothetical protein
MSTPPGFASVRAPPLILPVVPARQLTKPRTAKVRHDLRDSECEREHTDEGEYLECVHAALLFDEIRDAKRSHNAVNRPRAQGCGVVTLS